MIRSNPTCEATPLSTTTLAIPCGESTTASEEITTQIVLQLPFAQYLARKELSQSVLKVGRKSMKHLKAAWDEEIQTVPTDDMILGSALHTAFLEPEQMPNRVVKWTGGARRGKEWEQFKAYNADKYILTENMHEQLVGMCKSLRQHREVRAWLSHIEDVEVSGFGMVNGVRMKGRIDALTSDPLIDLKKVADGDKGLFRKNALWLGYHIQAAVYCELFQRDRFILMTVESDPPYDVVPWQISDDLMKRGRQEMHQLLDRVADCIEKNRWPGRAETIEVLDDPMGVSDQPHYGLKIKGA